MPARETTARIVRFWPGWRSVRRLGANTHECNHLLPLLEGIAEGTTVYADKGYDSKENRQHLKEHRLLDGIAQSPPQPPSDGSTNQTQPIFVEDPLCGRTEL